MRRQRAHGAHHQPCPFVLVSDQPLGTIKRRQLGDIAPTLLHLLGLMPQMTGTNAGTGGRADVKRKRVESADHCANALPAP